MRVLIAGASGGLGTELAQVFRAKGKTLDALSHKALDVTDDTAVSAFFNEREPFDVVINCAAMTDLDACEKLPSLAYAVNALGARNLARGSQKCGAKFVQISTDCVFDGTQTFEKDEMTPPNPVGIYGQTKYEGERFSLEACEKTFIIRTAWLFAKGRDNFVEKVIRAASLRGRVEVVSDEIGNPTYAKDLANVIFQIVQMSDFGIYHVTNAGFCSRYALACRALDLAGIPCERVPITKAQYAQKHPEAAPRPADARLANTRALDTIGMPMRSWEAALEDYMRERMPRK